MAKSGFLGRDEYLGRLSKGISGVQNSPGRLVQPLWDSSWDSWIKHYRPDENAGNSRISYYSKGAIVGMLLDAEIQSRTGGARGLRDVMQRLWKEHRQSGYTLDDFQRISSEVAGVAMDDWFRTHVWQATEVDYSKMLEWYGLRFKSSEAKKNGDASKADPAKADGANAPAESPSDKKVDKPAETGNAWLGCVTSGQDGRLVVRQVPRGTPADLAGLNVDDELIAIEDHRLSTTGLDDRLSYFSDGDTVRMTIARRSRVLTMHVKLGKKPSDAWQLEVLPEATEEQKKRLEAWLARFHNANEHRSKRNKHIDSCDTLVRGYRNSGHCGSSA